MTEPLQAVSLAATVRLGEHPRMGEPEADADELEAELREFFADHQPSVDADVEVTVTDLDAE